MRSIVLDRRTGSMIAAVIATAVLAVVVARDPPSPARRSVGGDPTRFGSTVDVATVLARAAACDCPVPGEAALSKVERAWVHRRQFGFVFDDRMRLSYVPTSETPDGFVERIDASIEHPDMAGPIGKLIPLRGTTAWVKEADGHGPAFVEWIEARRELTLIGAERQELADLLREARELVTSGTV